MARFLEALGDMPSEEDRTNPWDITGDEDVDKMPTHTEVSEPSRRKRSSSKPR